MVKSESSSTLTRSTTNLNQKSDKDLNKNSKFINPSNMQN